MKIENVKIIEQMRNEGKTNREVADFLGISSRTVEYWVKRLKADGVEIKTIRGKRPLKIT